jgi:hypothetical protein
VIVPEEVEDPVREVAVELLRQGPPLRPGTPDGGVQGDYHVAEERPRTRRLRYRKAEDVGGAVLPAPAAVEPADPAVGRHHHGELRVVPGDRREEEAGAAPEPHGGRATLRVLARDLDVHGFITRCTAGRASSSRPLWGYSGRVW